MKDALMVADEATDEVCIGPMDNADNKNQGITVTDFFFKLY